MTESGIGRTIEDDPGNRLCQFQLSTTSGLSYWLLCNKPLDTWFAWNCHLMMHKYRIGQEFREGCWDDLPLLHTICGLNREHPKAQERLGSEGWKIHEGSSAHRSGS